MHLLPCDRTCISDDVLAGWIEPARVSQAELGIQRGADGDEIGAARCRARRLRARLAPRRTGRSAATTRRASRPAARASCRTGRSRSSRRAAPAVAWRQGSRAPSSPRSSRRAHGAARRAAASRSALRAGPDRRPGSCGCRPRRRARRPRPRMRAPSAAYLPEVRRAVRRARVRADVESLARPDEQRDLHGGLRSEPAHLLQLGDAEQHRAAALRDPVHRDPEARRGLR